MNFSLLDIGISQLFRTAYFWFFTFESNNGTSRSLFSISYDNGYFEFDLFWFHICK